MKWSGNGCYFCFISNYVLHTIPTPKKCSRLFFCCLTTPACYWHSVPFLPKNCLTNLKKTNFHVQQSKFNWFLYWLISNWFIYNSFDVKYHWTYRLCWYVWIFKKFALFQINWLFCSTQDQLLFFPLIILEKIDFFKTIWSLCLCNACFDFVIISFLDLENQKNY